MSTFLEEVEEQISTNEGEMCKKYFFTFSEFIFKHELQYCFTCEIGR